MVEVATGIGGAKLTKSPEDITLLDVFRAVEIDEDLFNFHERPNPNCLVGRNIHAILDNRLDNVKKIVDNELRRINLQSLLDNLR